METDGTVDDAELKGNTNIKSGKVLIPQKPENSLQSSLASAASSPPCQQAYLSSSYHPYTHKTLRQLIPANNSISEESSSLGNIAEDSESASSSSSSLPQKIASPAHQHLFHQHKKSSPAYPSREHLTITPRHGFSVVKGGIDTLIEEEERSRSQTTTDDEDDGLLTEEEKREHILNPQQLASR